MDAQRRVGADETDAALHLSRVTPDCRQARFRCDVDHLPDGACPSVIVSVGGLLKIGDSYVLINPSSFAVSLPDGTLKAYLNATKEQLKNAPKYTYKKG